MSDRYFVDTNILMYALVVQAAEASGAAVLYSEDLSDGQIYCGVRVVNPLKAAK
jgi:predicted nucleic acid-binding protein